MLRKERTTEDSGQGAQGETDHVDRKDPLLMELLIPLLLVLVLTFWPYSASWPIRRTESRRRAGSSTATYGR